MDYLSTAQKTEFFNKLRSRIDDGSLVWQAVGDSDHEFIIETGNFLYSIASVDDDGVPPVVFEIWALKKEDKRLVADRLLEQITSDVFDTITYNIVSIYKKAQRQVNQADKIAQEILEELDPKE